MTVSVRVPGPRSLALIFTGLVLGAMLVAPVAARVTSASVGPAAIRTRVASCAGLSFYSANNVDNYDNAGPLRFHKGPTIGSNSGSTGVYRCDPGLPHRAVVTKVRFTVRDGSSDVIAGSLGYGVEGCALVRSSLTAATATSFGILASVPGTSAANPFAAPGDVRLTDSSIELATVDKAKFGYWLECRIVGDNAQTGIYGADVTYAIDATDG